MIASKTDIDLYKYKMLYFLWKQGLDNAHIVYRFFNRSAIRVQDYVKDSEILCELQRFIHMPYTDEELIYLANEFDQDFVEYLLSLNLSEPRINIQNWRNTGDGSISGLYKNCILFETVFLSIVNGLYCKRISELLDPKAELDIRKHNLRESIHLLNNTNVQLTEFGTRRRFSQEWQETVLTTLKKKLPNNLIGTSNVHLARKHNLVVVGTIAHEMYSFFAAMSSDKIQSQKNLVIRWNDIYPNTYHLTDTFGTTWFLKNCCKKPTFGLRQDSGFATKWLEEVGLYVPETTKTMFSDGLNAFRMIHISKFNKAYTKGFGWGSNATQNSLVRPLSIVMKLWEAGGKPCVKLSDNPAKAIGNPQEIEKYKWIFDYKNNITNKEEITY